MQKFLYGDRDSFIVHLKTDDIYKDIAKDVGTRFDTWNFEIDRPLPRRKNKKGIRLVKDELGGQIMEEFAGLKAKTCRCLKDNNDEDKTAKDTKKCSIKRNLDLKIIKIA